MSAPVRGIGGDDGGREVRSEAVARAYRLTLFGAVVGVVGVLTVLVGTLASSLVVDAGVATAAAGLAAVVYGVGGLTPAGRSRVTGAGVAVALAAVALSPTGTWGLAVGLPGGPWGLTYAVGLAVAVAGATFVPIAALFGEAGADADRDATDGDDGPEASSDRSRRDEEAVGGRTTAVVEPAEAGGWVWEVIADDGETLAAADRTYGSAAAARAATRRLVSALREAEPRMLTRRPDDEGEDVGSAADSGDRTPGEEPGGSDVPARLGGDGFTDAADEQAAFEFRETDDGWRWRFRYDDGTVVAGSTRGFADLEAARRAADRVRSAVPDAGTIAYDPAAVELYRTSDEGIDGAGDWRWRLRDADGEVTAVSPSDSTFELRAEAMSAVEALKSAVADDPDPDAAVAADAEGDGHRWRLRHDGQTVAVAPRSYEDADRAREAFERAVEGVPAAGVLELDPAGFAVVERPGDTWGWQLRDRDGRVLAESPPHSSRERAIEGLRTLSRMAPHAGSVVRERETTRAIEEALSSAARARSAVEQLDDDNDGDGTDSGESADRAADGEAGRRDASTADGHDPDSDSDSGSDSDSDPESPEGEGAGRTAPARVAAVVEPEPDAGPGGTAHRWRLVDREGPLASVAGLPDRDRATEDARRVLGALATAAVVAVDPAVVEVVPGQADDRDDGGDDRDARLAAPGGEWGWRLVDREGVVASAAGFGDADAARAAVATAGGQREDASDAEVEVFREDGWRWRLRHPEDLTVLATSDRSYSDTTAAESAARDARERLRSATVVDCRAAVECLGTRGSTAGAGDAGGSADGSRSAAPEAVRWRLRTVDGRVPVTGEGASPDRLRRAVADLADAVDPGERVRERSSDDVDPTGGVGDPDGDGDR